MLQLVTAHYIITGTDICTGTNGKDVACAGRNCRYYVTSPSGLIALVMLYNLFILSYCGVCKPVE